MFGKMLGNIFGSVVGRTVWSRNIQNANMQAQVSLWQRGEEFSIWFRSSRFTSVDGIGSWSSAGFRSEALPQLIDALKAAEAELHRLQSPKVGRQA